MPPLGAMIETPAALFALEDILGIVDFVSIGTNDLTQFILAVDRNEAELIEDCTVHHPAVIRAIAKVVRACREADRDVCVCGEAAGDPMTACLLVGLGVSQLSMSPLRAARVRYALRGTASHRLQHIAKQALKSDSAQSVQRLLKDLRAG
jgi:phosphoenolpyruvate-protein kinase (PTS system EI component)